jgi:L-ascorbate metabolism protein UlaG (beta-lactamase superfamily)
MGNDINLSSPSNVIYIFDVDGLRMAHLGDIAQDHLTPEQLQALGKVDIVFMMMEDVPYYGFTKEKELNILNQLNPQVIFPTHRSVSTIAEVKKIVDETLEIQLRWEVSKEDLKDGKRKLIFLNLW